MWEPVPVRASGTPDTPAAAVPSSAGVWQAGPRAKARLVAATTAVGSLATVPAALEVELDPGWKTYWRSPGDAGIPPGVDWQGSDNVAVTNFRWPAPERFDFFGIESFGYHDRVVFPIDITPSRRGEPLKLKARADLLVCDDVCIPHSLNLSLDVPGGPAIPSREAQLIDRFRALVPGDGARSGLSLEAVTVGPPAVAVTLRVAARSVVPFEKPDLIVEGPEDILFAAPKVARLDDGNVARFDVTVQAAFDANREIDLTASPLTLTLIDGNRTLEARTTPVPGNVVTAPADGGDEATSLLLVLGLALIGGLILNLMPCVLPVLAIKLLAVVGHGGGVRTEVRRGFLATTAGVVAAFLILATLAVGLKNAGLAVGWGIQFQQPLFIVVMVVILSLFACNMWGMFEIRLPGTVATAAAQVGGRHHGANTLTGHFLQGAFATILATPCSAPFLGTAVGFALSRGAGEIFSVFAALGLGMALPFLAVAAFPALATRLPRPGPWMIRLKRFLALALAATAVWLLTVLSAQVSVLAAGAVAALMLVLAMLLAVRRSLLPGITHGVPVLVVAIALLALAMPIAVPALDSSKPSASGVTGSGDTAWRVFELAEVPRLVAAGNIVFVDVTADWCITCQVNKKRVLDVGAVAAVLRGDRIVRMRADWTKPDARISKFLASHGRYGIPFNIVYGPTAPQGIALPELLTDSVVLEALAQADRSREIATR